VIDSPNHKELMNSMEDEMDSMARKRFVNSLILHPAVSLLKINECSRENIGQMV